MAEQENAIRAHMFGRRRIGDREEVKLSLYNEDGTPFTPGVPGPQGPVGPVGPAGQAGPQGPVNEALIAAPYSGYWFPMWGYAAMSGSALLYTDRFLLTRTVLVSPTTKVAIDVPSSPLAGSMARVLAYQDTSTGPGALIQASADIDCSTRGPKQFSLALPAGPVWLAFQNLAAANFNLSGVTGMNPYLRGLPDTLFTALNALSVTSAVWSAVGQGTGIKDPCPWPPATIGLAAPIVYFKAP